MTAQDFAFSWRRLLTPAHGAEYAYLLYGVRHGEALHLSRARAARLRGETLAAFDAPRGAARGRAAPRSLARLPRRARSRGHARARRRRAHARGRRRAPPARRRRSARRSAPGSSPPRPRTRRRRAEAEAHFGVDAGAFARDERTFVVELVAPIPYFLELTSFYPTFPVPRDVVEAHPDDWFLPGPHRRQRRLRARRVARRRSHPAAAEPHVVGARQRRARERRRVAGRERDHGAEPVSDRRGRLAAAHARRPRREAARAPRSLRGAGAQRLLLPRERDEAAARRSARAHGARARDRPRHAGARRAAARAAAGASARAARRARTTSRRPRPSASTPRVRARCSRRRAFPAAAASATSASCSTRSKTTARSPSWWPTSSSATSGSASRAYNQEWQSYLATTQAGDYDLSRAGWIGDYVDPNTFLDLWVTNGGNNQTGWGDPLYDRCIRAAADVEAFARAPELAGLAEPERARALLDALRRGVGRRARRRRRAPAPPAAARGGDDPRAARRARDPALLLRDERADLAARRGLPRDARRRPAEPPGPAPAARAAPCASGARAR